MDVSIGPMDNPFEGMDVSIEPLGVSIARKDLSIGALGTSIEPLGVAKEAMGVSAGRLDRADLFEPRSWIRSPPKPQPRSGGWEDRTYRAAGRARARPCGSFSSTIIGSETVRSAAGAGARGRWRARAVAPSRRPLPSPSESVGRLLRLRKIPLSFQSGARGLEHGLKRGRRIRPLDRIARTIELLQAPCDSQQDRVSVAGSNDVKEDRPDGSALLVLRRRVANEAVLFVRNPCDDLRELASRAFILVHQCSEPALPIGLHGPARFLRRLQVAGLVVLGHLCGSPFIISSSGGAVPGVSFFRAVEAGVGRASRRAARSPV